ADERTAGRLLRRRHDAMRGDAPEEAIRNAAEEDGLEERGVVEKGDEADFRPRIARRVADECEVVFVEDPAQVFEDEQHREDSDASRETHARSLADRRGRLSSTGQKPLRERGTFAFIFVFEEDVCIAPRLPVDALAPRSELRVG